MNFYCKTKTTLSLRIFIFLFMQICVFSAYTQAQQKANSKPNIIFILADDVGYSVPTVNGGQSYSTPRIDSMARNGMNFTHCEATAFMCYIKNIFFNR